MPTPMLLLLAVVAGWMVQLYLSYQQSMSFSDDVRRLRRSGTVSVGSGGRRYRGGRAFVALAFDEHGIVRDAIELSGFSNFARSQPFPAVVGLKAGQLRGRRDIPGLETKHRDAVRQAAELFQEGAPAPEQQDQPVLR